MTPGYIPDPGPSVSMPVDTANRLSVADRIRMHGFTWPEIQVAREAAEHWIHAFRLVRHESRSGWGKGSGGSGRRKYEGVVPMRVIERYTKDFRRQIQLAHLVIAMGREEVGYRDGVQAKERAS